jgi:hypothetical protein
VGSQLVEIWKEQDKKAGREPTPVEGLEVMLQRRKELIADLEAQLAKTKAKQDYQK